MSLELLNTNGPSFADAQGITPPLMRAICHVGFSVALGDQATDENWDDKRLLIIAEIEEAKNHLSDTQTRDTNPFIPSSAVEATNLLRTQFREMVPRLGTMSREDCFTDLKILAENCVYISAMLERYITGNEADEGRNP